MQTDVRILWLRRVLVVKTLVTVFVWGLPALLGPLSLLAVFGLPVPAEPVYLRSFGATVTAWGVAYWLAYRDPVRNVAILKAGLVDNALATLTSVVIGLTSGRSSAFLWLSAVLTGLFFLSFLILMPRQGQTVTT